MGVSSFIKDDIMSKCTLKILYNFLVICLIDLKHPIKWGIISRGGEMYRTFIQTNQFIKDWERMNLTDDDLRRLELIILKEPKIGKVIRGTGRLRKIRFAFEGEGKSGSARVCYVDFEKNNIVYLITAYPKSEKDTLSKEECNNIRKYIDVLEKNL